MVREIARRDGQEGADASTNASTDASTNASAVMSADASRDRGRDDGTGGLGKSAFRESPCQGAAFVAPIEGASLRIRSGLLTPQKSALRRGPRQGTTLVVPISAPNLLLPSGLQPARIPIAAPDRAAFEPRLPRIARGAARAPAESGAGRPTWRRAAALPPDRAAKRAEASGAREMAAEVVDRPKAVSAVRLGDRRGAGRDRILSASNHVAGSAVVPLRILRDSNLAASAGAVRPTGDAINPALTQKVRIAIEAGVRGNLSRPRIAGLGVLPAALVGASLRAALVLGNEAGDSIAALDR